MLSELWPALCCSLCLVRIFVWLYFLFRHTKRKKGGIQKRFFVAFFLCCGVSVLHPTPFPGSRQPLEGHSAGSALWGGGGPEEVPAVPGPRGGGQWGGRLGGGGRRCGRVLRPQL